MVKHDYRDNAGSKRWPVLLEPAFEKLQGVLRLQSKSGCRLRLPYDLTSRRRAGRSMTKCLMGSRNSLNTSSISRQVPLSIRK